MIRRFLPVFCCALLLSIGAPAAVLAQSQQAAPQGNCLPGDKIDGSTAEQAKAKFEDAGYSQVKIIRKGCDNFWHGSGVYGGVQGFMVLSPDGKVMPEGS
jgi:hypothetical protein